MGHSELSSYPFTPFHRLIFQENVAPRSDKGRWEADVSHKWVVEKFHQRVATRGGGEREQGPCACRRRGDTREQREGFLPPIATSARPLPKLLHHPLSLRGKKTFQKPTRIKGAARFRPPTTPLLMRSSELRAAHQSQENSSGYLKISLP